VLAIAQSQSVFFVDVPSCATRVIYNLNPRFKLADVRKLLDLPARAAGAPDGAAPPDVFIVVVSDKPTHAAINGVADLDKDVQFFQLKELLFNVTRHELQPVSFEVIRDPEAIAALVKKWAVKDSGKLCIISASDPVARYYAIKPGQVLRITRLSDSGGSYVLYRTCKVLNI
jgi:DNA-directed RNA polymerase subunit H (RpoH/RPB5)